MIIHCKDESNGLLFLAVEALSMLSELVDTIRIEVLPHHRERYKPLFDLFEKVEVADNLSQSPDLIFTRKVEPHSESALYFPILPAREQPEHALGTSYVPLNSARRINGYVLGETASAEDLLLRRKGEGDLKGKRLLISAGPTAEDMDPVRYLTNRSSGKMGIALARVAFRRGAEVTLILGPVSTPVPSVIPTVRVRSAAQMAEAVLERFPQCDAYFGAAALADYTPEAQVYHKIKKLDSGLDLNLKRTTDVLRALSTQKNKQKVIGFSVETNNILENSKRKLLEKALDMIVINNPKEAGAAFAVDTNRVTVLKKSGETVDFPLLSKLELSNRLLDLFKEL